MPVGAQACMPVRMYARMHARGRMCVCVCGCMHVRLYAHRLFRAAATAPPTAVPPAAPSPRSVRRLRGHCHRWGCPSGTGTTAPPWQRWHRRHRWHKWHKWHRWHRWHRWHMWHRWHRWHKWHKWHRAVACAGLRRDTKGPSTFSRALEISLASREYDASQRKL